MLMDEFQECFSNIDQSVDQTPSCESSVSPVVHFVDVAHALVIYCDCY